MGKTDTPHGPPEDKPQGPPTFTLTVYEPSEVEPKVFTWAKTMKVSDAAQEAASTFKVQVKIPTFENAQHEILDRNKPLVAAGVRDGDSLELVDIGGGV